MSTRLTRATGCADSSPARQTKASAALKSRASGGFGASRSSASAMREIRDRVEKSVIAAALP